ncbi:MAG TPA: hypothetical protein VFW27_39210 [Actinoplanes sp.]|nr:hypothetical protein [Actinoplanes sp.]
MHGLTHRRVDTAAGVPAGPTLGGPIAALLLTIAGRTATLPELSGPGAALISTRP